MEDSLLPIFGIQALINTTSTSEDGILVIAGDLEEHKHCPQCGGSHWHRSSKKTRILRLPSVGAAKAVVRVTMRRQSCLGCKHRWWPKIPFSRGKERMTLSFVQYALELLRFGTIQDVSEHLGVSWDVIKDVHKRHLKDKYTEVDIASVKYVGIDEFSIAKRHKYMTVILDISTGRIIDAVEGRKRKEISPILETLKKKHLVLKQ